MTDRNVNAREAEDLLEASMAAHMHLDRLHKAPVDNRSQIAAANQRIGISLKMADARATLAVAEEQRRTRTALEKISATLGGLVEQLTWALADEVFSCDEYDKCGTDNLLSPGLCDECAERHVRIAEEALEHPDDTDCARCGGPISPTADMCEACKQHADEEIDALNVSGPHEGEGRA